MSMDHATAEDPTSPTIRDGEYLRESAKRRAGGQLRRRVPEEIPGEEHEILRRITEKQLRYEKRQKERGFVRREVRVSRESAPMLAEFLYDLRRGRATVDDLERKTPIKGGQKPGKPGRFWLPDDPEAIDRIRRWARRSIELDEGSEER